MSFINIIIHLLIIFMYGYLYYRYNFIETILFDHTHISIYIIYAITFFIIFALGSFIGLFFSKIKLLIRVVILLLIVAFIFFGSDITEFIYKLINSIYMNNNYIISKPLIFSFTISLILELIIYLKVKELNI